MHRSCVGAFPVWGERCRCFIAHGRVCTARPCLHRFVPWLQVGDQSGRAAGACPCRHPRGHRVRGHQGNGRTSERRLAPVDEQVPRLHATAETSTRQPCITSACTLWPKTHPSQKTNAVANMPWSATKRPPTGTCTARFVGQVRPDRPESHSCRGCGRDRITPCSAPRTFRSRATLSSISVEYSSTELLRIFVLFLDKIN